MASVWRRPESQYWTACSAMKMAGSVRPVRKKQTVRRRKGSGMNTKRRPGQSAVLQPQAVLDRLREELSGERVVRTSLRQYLDDWFDAKKAETAPSTMTFYGSSLATFLEFLRKRSDDLMTGHQTRCRNVPNCRLLKFRQDRTLHPGLDTLDTTTLFLRSRCPGVRRGLLRLIDHCFLLAGTT